MAAQLPPAGSFIEIGSRTTKIGQSVEGVAGQLSIKTSLKRVLGVHWEENPIMGEITGLRSSKSVDITWKVGTELIMWNYPFSWFKDCNVKVDWLNGPQIAAQNPAEDSDETAYSSDEVDEPPAEAPAAIPQKSKKKPATLEPNGQKWTRMTNSITIDERAKSMSSDFQPQLKNGPTVLQKENMSYLAWFKLFWPVIFTTMIIQWTNEGIDIVNYNSPEGQINEEVLFRFLGILIGMCLTGPPVKSDFWSTDTSGFAAPFGMFERHGMSRDRFMFIRKKLIFWPSLGGASRWGRATWLVAQFNELMNTILAPGWLLCVDESFCGWTGKEGRHPDGMPNVSKIKGKPVGVGLLFKDTCCALCGLMIFIEIQQGKVWSATQEYTTSWGLTTACTLRLVKNWHGTGRLVLGDSWFASLATAHALLGFGLWFTGIVKTAYSKYPLKWMKENVFNAQSARGALATFVTTVTVGTSEMNMYAVGWYEPGRGKKPLKCFVSSCGLDAPTEVYNKKRWKVTQGFSTVTKYVKAVPCCKMIMTYFSANGAVDVHNQTRQGTLAMERNHPVHEWHFRWFCTMLGIICTNTWKAIRYFKPNSETLPFPEFADQLCCELTGYADRSTQGHRKRQRSRSSQEQEPVGGVKHGRGAASERDVGPRLPAAHRIRSIMSSEFVADKMKGPSPLKKGKHVEWTCSVCGAHASMYCVDCSAQGIVAKDARKHVAVCGSRSGSDCICYHIADNH
jgi:Transposase IS4